jgi:molybdate transport system substrate-binding protein
MLAGIKKISYVIFALVFLGLPHVAWAGEKLTIAAAADLAFALKEIGAAFEKEANVTPVISFGSTGNFTKQIEAGAPFDVFLAADLAHVDELKKGGFVLQDSVTVYAHGRIVVASNRKSIQGKIGINDLTGPSVRKVAIANPAHAPYGIAAEEALKNSGVWDKIKDKLVYGENVRQTLQYIQTGDAEAGIVAFSIAEVPEVEYTVIDPALYRPIVQAASVIKTTKEEKAARQFIAFIKSPAGKKILAKYGFGVD